MRRGPRDACDEAEKGLRRRSEFASGASKALRGPEACEAAWPAAQEAKRSGKRQPNSTTKLAAFHGGGSPASFDRGFASARL